MLVRWLPLYGPLGSRCRSSVRVARMACICCGNLLSQIVWRRVSGTFAPASERRSLRNWDGFRAREVGVFCSCETVRRCINACLIVSYLSVLGRLVIISFTSLAFLTSMWLITYANLVSSLVMPLLLNCPSIYANHSSGSSSQKGGALTTNLLIYSLLAGSIIVMSFSSSNGILDYLSNSNHVGVTNFYRYFAYLR